MGSWPACLLVKLLVEEIIFVLAFYYIEYTLNDHIIRSSEIITIWPLSVYILEVQCMKFMHREG